MYVRIFTYVKNEIELIEKWLQHHSKITKPYLIHVVDNGSTDGTWEVLEHYKSKIGICIHTHDDYSKKGEFLSSIMIQYKKQPGILLPLDADEFVILYRDDKVIKDTNTIREYIHKLPLHSGTFHTKAALFSIPEKPVCTNPLQDITKWRWEWNTPKMCKKFYVAQTFQSTDHGNHGGVTDNNTHSTTDIVLIHYHDTGYERYKFKCEQDIKNLGIRLDVVSSQLAEEGKTKGTNTHFTGRDKVNAYLNIRNWKYEPTKDYDVEFCFDDG